MSRRTLVFLGHPDQHSYCGAMAERAVEQALAKGDDVELLRLADLHFSNPVPRRAEDNRRLEPDVARFQEAIRAADHLVFIFPIWWGGMPGRFKLLLELALTPGFAFQYIPNSIRWTRLLNGKTAELLVTMDTPPWFYRTIYRDAGISELRRNILDFCGVKVTRVRRFGSMRISTESRRQGWLAEL
ncbi:MAG: NAD(P)H-dependent oxidoreductase [Rhodobacter sp.]|nr:NAD(P)H-dependent oxidoreductase [Rhodobacter sp.]